MYIDIGNEHGVPGVFTAALYRFLKALYYLSLQGLGSLLLA